tara:strand:+ start:47798 stop:48181 length:384 start_codon:yes stop_codon:yes gene_type:complete
MATINTDIAQKIDIIARFNNSMTINLTIKNSDNSVFDLSDYFVFFEVEDARDSLINLTNDTTYTSWGLTSITNELGSTSLSSSGIISIFVTSQELALNPGTYDYRLTLVKDSTRKTWMYGKFKVNKD